MSNFMKIRPVGAELFHANKRANRHDKANFANVPNNAVMLLDLLPGCGSRGFHQSVGTCLTNFLMSLPTRQKHQN